MSPMRSPLVGFTVEHTAQLVCALRWVITQTSDLAERWSKQSEDDEQHVWLAILARHFQAHLIAFEELQPDSKRMAPYRTPAPAKPEIKDALHAAASLCTDAETQLAFLNTVVVEPLIAACQQIETIGASHCDAPLMRVATALRQQLQTCAAALSATKDSDTLSRATALLDREGGLLSDLL